MRPRSLFTRFLCGQTWLVSTYFSPKETSNPVLKGPAEPEVPEGKNVPGSLLLSPEGGGAALKGLRGSPGALRELWLRKGQDPTPRRCKGPWGLQCAQNAHWLTVGGLWKYPAPLLCPSPLFLHLHQLASSSSFPLPLPA